MTAAPVVAFANVAVTGAVIARRRCVSWADGPAFGHDRPVPAFDLPNWTSYRAQWSYQACSSRSGPLACGSTTRRHQQYQRATALADTMLCSVLLIGLSATATVATAPHHRRLALLSVNPNLGSGPCVDRSRARSRRSDAVVGRVHTRSRCRRHTKRAGQSSRSGSLGVASFDARQKVAY